MAEQEREEGALVVNASDAKQLRNARKKERESEEDELADMRDLLASPFGDRILWRILTYCSTFESIFAPDPVVMAHRAGQQDVGHFLMSAIGQADSSALARLMTKQFKR